MELLAEIIHLISQEFFPDGILNFSWIHITVFFSLFFGYQGWKNGWQRGLITLVSLFLAWGIALRTTEFLLITFDELMGLHFGNDMEGFFRIMLYVASVVMVVVTANKVIGGKIEKPERVSGALTGFISGYIFVALLLDVGHKWFAEHIETREVAYLHLPGHLPEISTNFTNNPSEVYSQLLGWPNIVVLFIFLVFLRTFVSEVLGGAEKKLRPKKKG